MKLLIVVLAKSRFHLHLWDTEFGLNRIRINNEDFFVEHSSFVQEGFIGFFDWLRADTGKICGIRMYFFSGTEYYDVIKKKSSYPIFNDEHNSIIMKFQECLHKEEISDDKEFTHNFIYYGAKGQMAISFPLDSIDFNEIERIMSQII